MARTIRMVVIAAVAAWLAWNVYRHVAVYLVRGRLVVVTDRVLGNLLAGAGLLVALVAPAPATAAIAVLTVAAGAATRLAELWLVLGASRERPFERAAVVLRGMGFSFDHSDRSLEERGGRIRVSIVASIGPRAHVLRLRTTRGIKKVALFRANLRKFLVASPRERR